MEENNQVSASFVEWHNRLPENKYAVRFFDYKDFYTVVGEDALFVADNFQHTRSNVKAIGQNKKQIASLALNKQNFESIIRKILLEEGDRSIEVYEGSGSSWKLTRKASPGRLQSFEDELFKQSEVAEYPTLASIILRLNEQQIQVGVAYVNQAFKRLGACEFYDSEQFTNLDSLLTQLGVKECVVSQESATSQLLHQSNKMQELLKRNGILYSDKPKVYFSSQNLEQDLKNFIASGNTEQHRDILERPLACQALAAILQFSELQCDTAGQRKYHLQLYNMGVYMRVDNNAIKALNILPTRQDPSGNFSLYGLLNRAKTQMGKRLVKIWLKQPLLDKVKINERLDVVEAFVEDVSLKEQMMDNQLKGMPDIERLTRKLERHQANLMDLCQLYRGSARIGQMIEILQGYQGSKKQLMHKKYSNRLAYLHDQEHLQKYEQLIESAIDVNKIPEEYLISPNYSNNLQEVSAQKQEINDQINDIAMEIANDLNLQIDKSIKLEWHKINNQKIRCMRITQKEEKQVRQKLQAKYITLETRKDGTKFSNKALRAAAEKLQNLTSKYDGLQRDLVAQVVEIAATFVEVWEQVGAILAELDALIGFADLACSSLSKYVRPYLIESSKANSIIGEQGAGDSNGLSEVQKSLHLSPNELSEDLQQRVILKGCRHPYVEIQDGVNFIKNDCEMVKGTSWFQIITGPNMGGKSTYIRQVGVCILMAQIGSFVPCDVCEISIRDAIFCRVGAGDCQLKNVSTFMAEMLETASILKNASERSLVIIDELGRGTSTYDGFGLAWAISEYLMENIGCTTLFATHFHELTDLKGSQGVKNRHVATAIDDKLGKLTMLYQVQDGACDQSFGIHVAEFANFPAEVVQRAREYLKILEGQGHLNQASDVYNGTFQADTSLSVLEKQNGQTNNKRPRDQDEVENDRDQANQAIVDFVSQFQQMNVPGMDDVQLQFELAKMIDAIKDRATENPILRQIVKQVEAQ